MAYKKLFIDSDIILDFLLGREPFASYAKPLVSDRLNVKIYTSALVLANVHYIVARDKNKHIAKDFLQDLMPLFHVLPFTEESIHFALNYNTVDFEDTMQYFIAHKNKCEAIITRNLKHYKMFDLPVLTAEQYLRTVIEI